MIDSKTGRTVSVIAGLILGGAAAVTYSNYRQDIERARERVATGSQVVETPCGPIEYAVAGDGPPVLAVHGAGGGYDQGMDFGGPLAQRAVPRPMKGGRSRIPSVGSTRQVGHSRERRPSRAI